MSGESLPCQSALLLRNTSSPVPHHDALARQMIGGRIIACAAARSVGSDSGMVTPMMGSHPSPSQSFIRPMSAATGPTRSSRHHRRGSAIRRQAPWPSCQITFGRLPLRIAGREPHTHAGWQRDHRGLPSASDTTAAVSVATSTAPVMRIRAPGRKLFDRTATGRARLVQAPLLIPGAPSPARSQSAARPETLVATGSATTAICRNAALSPKSAAAFARSPGRS